MGKISLEKEEKEWKAIIDKVQNSDEVISNNAFWLEMLPRLVLLNKECESFLANGQNHIKALTDEQIMEEAYFALRHKAVKNWEKKWYGTFQMWAYQCVRGHLHTLYYKKKAKPSVMPVNGVCYIFKDK